MKLVIIYAFIAAFIATVTSPIPGTSVILTILEIGMAYHIARRHGIKLSLETLGVFWTTILVIAELLKLAVSMLLEIFAFTVIALILKPVIAFCFVLILGWALNLYFKDKPTLINN